MARKSSPTILQEELYPSSDDSSRPDIDDARMLDLDGAEESPFLRGQKRVSVRRGALPQKAAHHLKWIVIALFILGVCGSTLTAFYRYGERSWRFRITSSDDIEITGNHNVTRGQIMEVLGGDIGRNIFFVSLAQRKAQLEKIPWVESASVMRFVPNRLKIEIHERTPVAFARVGSHISLIDANGMLMDLSANKKKYSFPVIVGMGSGEPLSTRAARVKIYNELVRQLDSGGARYSQDLSEVDLSDPDDVKVLANDPQGAVLVHLGSNNYLERYKIYVSHVQGWRQQFDKLESVDLRYDRQIVVNPDSRGISRQAPLSASVTRLAAAAGVKPAALVTHVVTPPAKASSTPKPASKTKAKLSRRALRRQPTKRTSGKSQSKAPPPKPEQPAALKTPAARTTGSAAPPQVNPVKAGRKPSPAIAKEQGRD
jgi:cell division protein FtsQ